MEHASLETTSLSRGPHIPPATILERICRVQEVGAFKAAGVGYHRNREWWGAVGPGKIVVEDEAVGRLVAGG